MTFNLFHKQQARPGLTELPGKRASLVFPIFTCLFLSACGGGSSSGSTDDANSNTAPVASAGNDQSVTTGATGNEDGDITNLEFSNISGDCETYVGSYFSDVLDVQRAINFMGDIFISSTGTTCTITSNDIPNHDFNDATASFATDVSEQNLSHTFTRNPVFAAGSTGLTLGQNDIVMLNGVILDILPAACYGVGNESLGNEKIGCGPDEIDNPWRYDPMSPLSTFGTDIHNAHVQPQGAYHYHGNPVSMFAQDCSTATESSPVIGFAADGFPVYGSCIVDPDTNLIRNALSSFTLKDAGGTRQDAAGYTTPVSGVGAIVSANYDGQFRGDWEYSEGEGDLDECNGMTVDGQYGYYVTDTFPWVINCFQGEADSSF